MPHFNRSRSASNSRLLPSQGQERKPHSRPSSMPKSEPSSYNASIRRLGSRRPRPTVASIADVFVTSLVMASFCHEHSPRGQRISTICRGASTNDMARWHGSSVAGNRQLASSRKYLDYSRPPVVRFGVHCPRTQRMFSSGAAQSVEDPDRDGDASREKLLEDSPKRSCKETGMEHGKNLDDNSPDQLPDQSCDDSIMDISTFSNEPNELNEPNNTAPVTLPDDSTSPDPTSGLYTPGSSTNSRPPRPRAGINIAGENHTATSELYRATLGKHLDWEEAVDTVTKHRIPEYDTKSQGKKLRKFWHSLYRNQSKRSAVKIPAVRVLTTALWQEERSNQYIFRLYRDVPVPGVSLLSKRSRGELLRRFAKPPDHRWVDARRFLSLVEDMTASQIPMSRSLWTSGINMAGIGRTANRVLKQDLIRAIGTWQQMEHVANIKSDDVTFNVLFHIAIKAGQYTVADRFLKEMGNRGLSFDRCGKVTMIFYYGMCQDVDGIREAYSDLANSGELVDTVALNCLIVSFIRAGEIETAEQLYHRMLQAQVNMRNKPKAGSDGTGHHLPTLSSEFNIYSKRTQRLRGLLKASAVLKNAHPAHHVALQGELPLTPDTRTFYILLKFHAHQSGSLRGFMSIMADMENTFTLPPRGLIYVLLFEGFSHNGHRRKTWSAERLQEAWTAYLRALYESKHRLDERYSHQTRKVVWENPLASTAAAQAKAKRRPKSDDTSSELYTPLPSSNSNLEAGFEEEHAQMEETNKKSDDVDYDVDEDLESDIELEKLFDGSIRTQQESHQEELQEELKDLEARERRIENGVFLGRKMIVTILRAFGTCCGPEEVMDVWLKIERIWQPEKRKVLDVIVVKEELEKQINRIRR